MDWDRHPNPNPYPVTPTQVISSVEGHIDWEAVNRTAFCPPPPPKQPGAVSPRGSLRAYLSPE